MEEREKETDRERESGPKIEKGRKEGKREIARKMHPGRKEKKCM